MDESQFPVPRHVAIIMDGNGRWAEARGQPRADGHAVGAESVREVARACRSLGVEALTLYSFSTENWNRPPDEVGALMALCEEKLREMCDERSIVQRRGVCAAPRVSISRDLPRASVWLPRPRAGATPRVHDPCR